MRSELWRRWWRRLGERWGQMGVEMESERWEGESRGWWREPAWWRGLAGRSPEIMEVAAEVAEEGRGQFVLVSRQGVLCSRVLGRLRQQPAVALTRPIDREGFFTLVAVGASGAPGGHWRGGRSEGVGEAVERAADEAVEEWMERDPGGWEAGWEERVWPTGAYLGSGYGGGGLQELLLATVAEADLVLYLCAAGEGWQDEDARWFGRLRAVGKPLLPVLVTDGDGQATAESLDTQIGSSSSSSSSSKSRGENEKEDEEEDEIQQRLVELWQRRLGVRPLVLATVVDGNEEGVAADLVVLLRRILEMRPRLAIPLAQEMPWARGMIAERVIRTGALMTLLLGTEPIPLLDLPLQVGLQWKMALQLAAIYGRPGLDYRSREMMGTVLVNLCVRQVAQQALKLVPVVGWLISGVLSGSSTWLLGETLRRAYEREGVGPKGGFPLGAGRGRWLRRWRGKETR